MLEKQSKSVFDRLEDIEKKLEDKKEDLSISEMIGEPFKEYMESSKIYYYEPDERKFLKYKSKEIKRFLSRLITFFILMIVHLIVGIIHESLLLYFCIVDLLLIFLFSYPIIYLVKQQRKQLADSKYNIHNHRFYIYDNKLGEEDDKGLMYKIFYIFQFIYAFVYVAVIIFSIFNIHNLFLLINMCIFILIMLSFSGPKIVNQYPYHYYIFEKEDSYVVTDGFNWEKKLKNKENG